MKQEFFGLTDQQVLASRQEHGSNQLAETPSQTFWDKLKGNLKDPIIKILILAFGINVIFAIIGESDWLQTVGIGFAVVLSTMISTWSEHSNEEAFQRTQSDASKIMTKVYRNGRPEEIIIDDLVQGDLVILQSGDKIPADGKLLHGSLILDQSALNGESDEAKKEVGEGQDFKDTFNPQTLFRGTVVTSGEGVMELMKVGSDSMYGQMAAEMTVDDMESPLKAKLKQLAGQIAKLGYTAGVLVFLVVMFQNIFMANQFDNHLIHQYVTDWATFGHQTLKAFILGVIIVVIAVPEGLPLMIALVLSLNMKKMLKSQVLVRKLIGIETSGNLNLLFSDKTGTITKGQLEVVTIINGANQQFDSFGDLPRGLNGLVQAAVIHNTNAIVTPQSDGILQILGGNATERAVLNMVDSQEPIIPGIKTVSSIPFSSDRKFSASKVEGALETTLIKGAPEKILPFCQSYFDSQGQKQVLTSHAQLDQVINDLANRSIRVLVLAVTDETVTEQDLPSAYTLVAVLGIRDDVRPEAVTAIKEVQQAGIQVVMITGDRKETAMAISREAGILRREAELVLDSQELNGLSDQEVRDCLPAIRVIARALPTDKSRLVRLSQELGMVVGMTGDGVNDGPALKRADVGFAMGSGTEVAKEAGDIVILDDNFQSIAQAILYGRTIYHSIQKFIMFQLTLNVAALATNILAPLLGVPSPFTIIQMLWVNLVMDSMGALAFGSEPALKRYMSERPKKRTEPILSKQVLAAILSSGLALTAIGVWFLTSATPLGWFGTEARLYTAYFAFFILFSVVNAFNTRTEKLNIFANIQQNPMFIRIMLLIVIIQVGMIYLGGEILRTVPLSIRELGIVSLLSLLALVIGTLRKLIFPIKQPAVELEIASSPRKNLEASSTEHPIT